MENNIIHEYPMTINEEVYKDRYSAEVFEKYKKITKSIENYKKWKIGINHRTNRKIQIGGKLHKELEREFYIQHITSHGYSYILFTKLDGINIQLYIEETEKIKKEIEDYNSKVYDIICKINLLEKWEEYILFEGTKYGIPYVYENIHRENNCLGLITEDYYKGCSCHCCEDWGGCSNPIGTQYYKCEKCDYKYGESSNYSKNYKGK
jgi:hypothetical protein